MSHFRPPFVDFTKIAWELIHFLSIFVRFRHFRALVVNYQQWFFLHRVWRFKFYWSMKMGCITAYSLYDQYVKQIAYVHNVGSNEQTTSWADLFDHFTIILPHGNLIHCQSTRCHTAISRNDPISLSNEIDKLLDNSPSDKPFHVIFSVNYE